MLTSRNGVDGDVGGGTFVGVSFIGDGNIMDGFQVAGTSASSIGDSLLTFSPLKDAELLRRRARNNSILAKIQELEANASVQAARSERLRMMREEYETLVRKYASARKWNGGLGWNGNNGYHQNAYQPCNSQQQPFISSPSTSTAPPLLLPQPFFSTTLGRSSSSSQPPLTFQPTRDISSNINPTFSTAGVNTDITGPVRPIIMMETGQSEENDLQQWRNEGTFKLKHEKVKFALDSDSQTEQLRPKPASAELHSSTMATTMMMPLSSSTPQPSLVTQPGASTSSAATSFLHDREGQEHNRKMVAVGFEKDEQECSLQNDGKKNLPAKMEMMMMLEEEEEDDDDESLLQAGRKTMRKQQLQQLHQGRIKPEAAAALDDNTGSISFTSNSNPTETTLTTTMSKDITEEVPTPRQRQEKKWNGKKLKSKADDSTSGDNTTTSLAPARRKNSAAAANNDDDDNDELSNKNGAGGERKGSKYIQFDVSDPSFSDSISAFQSHQRQRKLLLQQLSTSKTSNLKNKGGADDEDEITGRNRNNNESTTTEDEDDDDDNDEEMSVIKGSKEKGHNDHDQYLLSPNTTSACGATSESIEDSLMDSIQKTPDTLPKDDSELHGIAEVKDEEEEQEQEEIELDNGNKLPSCDKKDDDDENEDEEDWRIPATAGESSKDERILTQSGVNDKPSDRTGTSLEEAQNGIKELEPNAQINDAKEIRSNNLSSSKLLDVGAEKDENSTFTHANNRVKNDNGSTNQQQQKSEEKKNFDMFYGNVEQPTEDEEANVQSHKGQFGEKLIEQKENEEASNVENKRKSDSQAPSANMSTHSSSITTTSSSSSGLNNATDDVNALQKEDHPNRLNHPKRKSSTGSSSSTSSSRQHSLDELVVGADGGSKGKGQNLSQQDSTSSGSPPKAAPIPTQRSSSTLPQSAQKRHHQLQQQLRKNNLVAKEGTPPVGADNTPEHLSSTISPKSQSPAAATTQSAANTGDDNNATKGTGGAEKVSPTPSQKTTKTSPVTASPSSGRTGDKVGNPNGTNGTTTSTTGNATGATSNIRSPKLLKSPILPKTGPTTTTSTQNAGRKMRLKLNYDDSESDSSEIAPIKILPTSTTPTGNQADATTNNGSQQQTSIINAVGSSTQQSNAAKKPAEDDEFDDFFDI